MFKSIYSVSKIDCKNWGQNGCKLNYLHCAPTRCRKFKRKKPI